MSVKRTYTTGTGLGNTVTVTEKPGYTWLEFSCEGDCNHYLTEEEKAEFKGVKTKVSTVQNEDLSWSRFMIKTYQVMVRK